MERREALAMTPTSAAIEGNETRSGRDRRGGFTLMEVVLALTIAGMLATLAVPYFRTGVGAGTLRARANAIASLLRRDRNTALHLQQRSTIIIDVKSGSVRSALLGQTIAIPKDITIKLLPERKTGVVFQPDGSSSGARILLATKRASIAIDVNRLTAAIGISELTDDY
jgi:general secretion pathway protein H